MGFLLLILILTLTVTHHPKLESNTIKATSLSKHPAPDEPKMKKHVKKSRLEDKVTETDGKCRAKEGGDTEQEDSRDKYKCMRAEAEADYPVCFTSLCPYVYS